jgi:hypothetical protein
MEALWDKKGKAPPLGFGLAWHEAIAAYRVLRLNKPESTQEQCFNAAATAFLKSYKAEMPAEFLSETLQDDKRSARNGLRLLEGYITKYYPMNLKAHYVEQSFGINLGKVNGRDIIYAGIIDSVLEMQGQFWVNDEKTTAMNITQSYLDGFRLSQQLMGYVVGGKAILKEPIYGCLVHVSWVQKEAKSAKSKPLSDYFHLQALTFTEEQLSEWQDDTLETVREIFQAQESGKWIHEFGDACNTFNGCALRELCWSKPASRPLILQQDFEKRTWTPLEDVRSRRVEEED